MSQILLKSRVVCSRIVAYRIMISPITSSSLQSVFDSYILSASNLNSVRHSCCSFLRSRN